jgi:hypothetical protein
MIIIYLTTLSTIADYSQISKRNLENPDPSIKGYYSS